MVPVRVVKLQTVAQREPGDSLIAADRALPVLKGTDPKNLACGGCEVVLFEGVDQGRLYNSFAAPQRLLLQCPRCGTLSILPAQRALGGRTVPTEGLRLAGATSRGGRRVQTWLVPTDG